MTVELLDSMKVSLWAASKVASWAVVTVDGLVDWMAALMVVR